MLPFPKQRHAMDKEEIEATLQEFGSQISAIKFMVEIMLANAIGSASRENGQAFIERLLDLATRTDRYPTDLSDDRAVELSDHAIRTRDIVGAIVRSASVRAGLEE